MLINTPSSPLIAVITEWWFQGLTEWYVWEGVQRQSAPACVCSSVFMLLVWLTLECVCVWCICLLVLICSKQLIYRLYRCWLQLATNVCTYSMCESVCVCIAALPLADFRTPNLNLVSTLFPLVYVSWSKGFVKALGEAPMFRSSWNIFSLYKHVFASVHNT